VRGLGDLAAAQTAYTSAARWASRFALSYFSDWVAQEQAYQAYHRVTGSRAGNCSPSEAEADASSTLDGLHPLQPARHRRSLKVEAPPELELHVRLGGAAAGRKRGALKGVALVKQIDPHFA
jgi:hypothetical protein